MSLQTLYINNARDFYLPTPFSRNISFQEYVSELIDTTEYDMVGRIVQDIEDHNQAYIRWLIRQMFCQVTRNPNARFEHLILNYMSWTRDNTVDSYSDLKKYIEPQRNEPDQHYTFRIFTNYKHLLSKKPVLGFCNNVQDGWKLYCDTMLYFKFGKKKKNRKLLMRLDNKYKGKLTGTFY